MKDYFQNLDINTAFEVPGLVEPSFVKLNNNRTQNAVGSKTNLLYSFVKCDIVQTTEGEE